MALDCAFTVVAEIIRRPPFRSLSKVMAISKYDYSYTRLTKKRIIRIAGHNTLIYTPVNSNFDNLCIIECAYLHRKYFTLEGTSHSTVLRSFSNPKSCDDVIRSKTDLNRRSQFRVRNECEMIVKPDAKLNRTRFPLSA